ncbi:MAG: hypothetical protein ACLR6W_10645 [Evtepia sp.]
MLGQPGLSWAGRGLICWPHLLTAWGSLWLPPLQGEGLYGGHRPGRAGSGSYSAAVFLADDLFALGALPWELGGCPAGGGLIGEGIAFAKRIKEDTWNLSFET